MTAIGATSHRFKGNAHDALRNALLQEALGAVRTGFQSRRLASIEKLPEFEALRERGREIKNHVLENLDWYLELYERNATAAGAIVHWARNADEARRIVLEICRGVNARTITKGKTMIGEEILLNDYLAENGVVPVETDLGEYIIQLRHETPSHIIAPALHLTKGQIEETFREVHTHLPADRNLEEARTMVAEARTVLRDKFLAADVGLTGANFLVAETGSSVIVTNEGNGDLTQLLPKAHIVLTSIEKVVPSLDDLSIFLRLLARSATGQEMSVYTTMSTGPKREGDPDGPGQYHVVILDNGRSELIGSEMQDILRCIRCGACMNHCPVFEAVGGHAYGWVYPGPMGAVLTPALIGLEHANDLPNASTFCGRCESVCPVKIPLPGLMRRYREQEWEQRLSARTTRWAVKLWAFAAKRPALYAWGSRVMAAALGRLGRGRGSFFNLPLAAGWTATREMPAPEGKTFREMWRDRAR